MIIKYEGKDYELGEITNIGDLEKAIKNKRITSLLAEGHLRWNTSYFINGVFYSCDELKNMNLDNIDKMTIILQLAGG